MTPRTKRRFTFDHVMMVGAFILIAISLLGDVLSLPWLLMGVTLLYAFMALIWCIGSLSQLSRQRKLWQQHDALFLATLKNMELVARDDMLSDEEKRRSLEYLTGQYRAAVMEELKKRT